MSARRSSRESDRGSRAGASGRGLRLRVTGGSLRGRRLSVPLSGVRPSSDRVRESMFARLPNLEGGRTLDLFAGSGVLGIEALSRGAASCVFVDHAREPASVVEANLQALQLSDRTRVLHSDCLAAVGRLGRSGEQFELLLLDPPYGSDALIPALEAIVDGNLLAPDALVVVETAKRHAVLSVAGLSLLDEREYGETRLTRLIGATGQELVRLESGGSAHK